MDSLYKRNSIAEFLINKKNIFIIVLVLLILFLLFSVFKKDKEKNRIQKEYEQSQIIVDSLLKEKKYYSDIFKKRNDEIEKEIGRYDTLVQTLNVTIDKSQQSIKEKTRLIRRLLSEASAIVVNESDSMDNVSRSKVDSAYSEIDQVVIRNSGLELQVNDLQEVVMRKDAAYKSLEQSKNEEIERLTASFNELLKRFNLSQDEVKKLMKKIKRRGFLNRAQSAALLAAIGYLFIKK